MFEKTIVPDEAFCRAHQRKEKEHETDQFCGDLVRERLPISCWIERCLRSGPQDFE